MSEEVETMCEDCAKEQVDRVCHNVKCARADTNDYEANGMVWDSMFWGGMGKDRAKQVWDYIAKCQPPLTNGRKTVKKWRDQYGNVVPEGHEDACVAEFVETKESDPDECPTSVLGFDYVAIMDFIMAMKKAQLNGTAVFENTAAGLRCPVPVFVGSQETPWTGLPHDHPAYDTLTADQICQLDPCYVLPNDFTGPRFVLPPVNVPVMRWVEQFVFYDGDFENLPPVADCFPGQIAVSSSLVVGDGVPNAKIVQCGIAICSKKEDGTKVWTLSECPVSGIPYSAADFPETGGDPNGQPCGDGVRDGDFLIERDEEGTKLGAIAVCIDGVWCKIGGAEPVDPPVDCTLNYTGQAWNVGETAAQPVGNGPDEALFYPDIFFANYVYYMGGDPVTTLNDVDVCVSATAPHVFNHEYVLTGGDTITLDSATSHTVAIYDASGNVIATDTAGSVSASGLTDGTYYLAIWVPAGECFSPDWSATCS